jgi:hypothetical protein
MAPVQDFPLDLSGLVLDTNIPLDGDDRVHANDVVTVSEHPLGSPSISGLSAAHRAAARARIGDAALLGYHKRDRIHYTQGPDRWDGIAHHRFASRGDFPREADCSAFYLWAFYQGVRYYKLRDVVNDEAWLAGWTGTMAKHGKVVHHDADILLGDAVLYGAFPSFEHVAIALGPKHVISHGSEGGPYYLPIDYRNDRAQVRRYL